MKPLVAYPCPLLSSLSPDSCPTEALLVLQDHCALSSLCAFALTVPCLPGEHHLTFETQFKQSFLWKAFSGRFHQVKWTPFSLWVCTTPMTEARVG